ncbi:MAG: SOS response-associated peptidase [Pseudomonadota bacterium]|jgi:putative SOS response-associated peptidase YedK|nr:SOS response-associated peptidase [Pseudomonadota bacterium]
MCGRYSLTTPIEGIRRLFGFERIPNLPARHNIAPTQAVLAVREENSVRTCFMARWGLIPGWSKDPSIGAKMINARAETVREKPSFKTAFKRRRCLIPVDAFYEWKTLGGKKQPFRIAFDDGEVFAFAGLWERWQGADGSDVETCSIVTTEANEALHDLHHRMPVIVDPHRFETWLHADEDEAARVMRPYVGARKLVYHPVSPRLNDVRNDDEDLSRPIELDPELLKEPAKKSDDQMSLF